VSQRSASSPFLPLLSAVLLYLYSAAWKVFAVLVLPLLLALQSASPRLGALGWLALATSPVLFVALIHAATHGVLDWFDSSRPRGLGRASSVWAGLFAWFAMTFAAMTSALLTLVVFPPPRPEAEVDEWVRLVEDVPFKVGVHALFWVATAAVLYAAERAANATSAKGGGE
jgi:hypothetical protein